VPAVTRAVAILRLLGASKSPMGVNAVASRLGLVPSTCLHILRVLVAEELVRVDPETKRYSLDAGILSLARSVLRPSSFSRRVQVRLEQFVQQFPVTALASRIVNLDHMVVIGSASSLALRIDVEVGSRQPALMSASGRCVAAFSAATPARIRAGFDKVRWDNPPNFERWWEEVEETRRLGYSIDRGNYMNGVTIVAAPVLGKDGHISYALVALGFSEQIESAGIDAIATALRGAAEELSDID
jgi:DNA-binding IclR family transcriptional regulator